MATDPGSEAGYALTADASLRTHNTLHVEARAAALVELYASAALPALLAGRALRDRPWLLLGEGSNVLFVGDFDGVIVTAKNHGVEVLEDAGDSVRIRVAAGEHWDDFVRWTLGNGYAGLENLIMIPGSVGAAPMQNIGAYGVEAGEFITAVDAFDLRDRVFTTFNRAECQFAYRDSIFKRHADRWLITAVTFALPRAWQPRVDYTGLREELRHMGSEHPAPFHVADAVVNLRTRKLPDPNVIGNAGSFFKNPLLPAALAARLVADHPQLPHWPAADGTVKLSAAWLIESAGFKGAREGDAGMSNRHALVLVNHGHASGAELWAFAQHVRDGVYARFAVMLEPEPRIIGGVPVV